MEDKEKLYYKGEDIEDLEAPELRTAIKELFISCKEIHQLVKEILEWSEKG